jgi:hypothetical protein
VDGHTRLRPQFTKVDLEDAIDVPAAIPARVAGCENGSLIQGWNRDVRNEDLSCMLWLKQ